jgi:hypothetical protein
MNQNPDRLENVLDNGYDFQLGNYISRGFNIFGKNAGMFIGYLFIYFCITFALALIPILGQIASGLISSSLIAGYFIVADKTDRGENAQFSNFFDGFQSWGQLVVAAILTGLLALALCIPFIIYVMVRFGTAILTRNVDSDSLSSFGALDVIAIIAFFVAIFYLSISFIYTGLFIVFDKMESWAAMMASRKLVEKNMLMHFFFLFAWGFIIIISALPLGLGLLVTIPAAYCSMYVAWADITNYHEEFEVSPEDDIMRHLID